MAPHAIISYDGTPADRDALMLGRVLREAGADLTLAYIRHATQSGRESEELAAREAEHMLARAALWLDEPAAQRRVVLSASTGAGLGWLAGQEQADMIVFGSEYRTPSGAVSLGRSAQTLLERGPAALAIAPAGYCNDPRPISRIGVLNGSADEAAIETAFSIAQPLQATVIDSDRGVDLLIVGSRSEAPEGHVTISSRSRHGIDEARSPVLVVARGAALRFETLVTA